MRRLIVLASALLLTISAAGSAIAADPGATDAILAAELTGASEVPGPGDPDGQGFAVIQVQPGAGMVCWFYQVHFIGTPTAAHIHAGAVGVAGDVVIPLGLPGRFGFAFGCGTASFSLLSAISLNPGSFYVNVHNATYPAGAVRGQLQHTAGAG